MYTAEMLESIKKVEATRAQRLGVEPRRMTAEEKDAVSHRGAALRKLKAALRETLEGAKEC